MRRASTLIIVVGLAMLMLSISLAYLTRMRDSGLATSAVVHDAQARLMLVAAMSYICESSRIGWGQETFGWNDVRDHAPGPRTIDRLLPHGSATWRESDTVWPAPGSVVRCPMYVMTRPPYAIANLGAVNRIEIVPHDAPVPDGGYREPEDPSATTNIFMADGTAVNSMRRLADFSRLDPIPAIAGLGEALPLAAGRYADFEAGDDTPLTMTREYGWFRIYRERPDDHDGDGTPWYDTLNVNGEDPLTPNVSIFVITVGSGASFGFTDFAEANAAQPGLFLDAAHFDLVRASEVVLRYRVEWSSDIPVAIGLTEGNTLHPNPASTGGVNGMVDDLYTPVTGPFGSIRWIQRLDRDPPRW